MLQINVAYGRPRYIPKKKEDKNCDSECQKEKKAAEKKMIFDNNKG